MLHTMSKIRGFRGPDSLKSMQNPFRLIIHCVRKKEAKIFLSIIFYKTPVISMKFGR